MTEVYIYILRYDTVGGCNAFATGTQDMLWVAVRQTENNVVYTTHGPYIETHIYIVISLHCACTH